MEQIKHPKVSYIIPFYRGDEGRYRNLLTVLEWISSFSDIEIIIAELGMESRIDVRDLPSRVKTVFYQDEGVFNRSLARNIGALHAKGDLLVFGDADFLIHPEHLKSGIDLCRTEYSIVNPWSVCFFLNEQEYSREIVIRGTEEFLNGDQTVYLAQKERHMVEPNLASGMLIIRKESLFSFGGWPMEMIGWGAEDDVFSYIAERLFSVKTMTNLVFHLPHERGEYDFYDHPEYDNNCRKMNMVFSKSDDELVQYLEGQRDSLKGLPCTDENRLFLDRLKPLHSENLLENHSLDGAVYTEEGQIKVHPFKI